MEKVIVVAPTSVLARNFIKVIRKYHDVITVGRNDCDITWDLSDDDIKPLPVTAKAIVSFAGVLVASNDMDYLRMIDINSMGALRLAIAAKKSGIDKYIYISSINALLSEESDYYGYYSISKKYAEDLLKKYCADNNIELTIIRPSQIFGIDEGYGKTQNLLYSVIDKAKRNENIVFYGSKDSLRNYVYDENVINLIVRAIKVQGNHTIDAIDMRNYKLSEMANIICDIYESSSEVTFDVNQNDMSDNGFICSKNYFSEWDIPFISFRQAVENIKQSKKRG